MAIDKNLIKLVNEEIHKYDFLGGDVLREEQEYYELIENEDFQKQFITDFILGKIDKYKIVETTDARIGGDYDTDFAADETNHITIDYGVRIEYNYDPNKKPVQFELYFDNDEKIGITVTGQEDSISGSDWGRQRVYDSWIASVDWDKINVEMFSTEGDTIEFKAFKRAPAKIRELFIREFTKDLITDKTTMEIREK